MTDTATPAERAVMADLIKTALEAHQDESRNGIVAALMRDGEVLAKGENAVKDLADPTKHAEMVAFTKAGHELGSTDLSGLTLLSTLQPCEMCLAAMRFAGIKRVIFAATQERVAGKYFSFPGLKIGDFLAAGEPFEHVGGVLEDQVLHLYEDGDE